MFPRASPLGTPSGEGVYLTVYPLSPPNTDTVTYSYKQMGSSLTLYILGGLLTLSGCYIVGISKPFKYFSSSDAPSIQIADLHYLN